MKEVVDLAHIVPRSGGGRYTKENLTPLCPNHHRLFDRGRLTREDKAKIKTVAELMPMKKGLIKGDSKANIRLLVEEYIRLFPQEFSDFKRGNKARVDLLAKKTGEIKGNDVIIRPIAEWPETLDTIFLMKLSKDDREYLHSVSGIRWFASTFKVFSSVEKV